jgi:PAS domain S-box-containing protein
MSAGQGLPLDTLISSIAAVGFSLSALYVAIALRHRPTWKSGIILLCACAEITAAHLLQQSSSDPGARLIWYKMAYVGFTVTPTAFLVFTLVFSGSGHELTNRIRLLLFVFPLLTTVLIVTNEFHGLVWNPARSTFYAISGDFLAAEDAGPWYWVFVSYSYLAMGTGCFFLIRQLVRSHQIYGWQTGIVIGAAILSILGSILDIFRISPLSPFSATALGLAVGSLMVVYALSPLRRRDLLSVTRATIFNSITDAIIVLDGVKRIVTVNLSSEKLVGRPASKVIFQPLKRYLPELVPLLTDEPGTNVEVVLERQDIKRTYDLRLTLIQDWQKHVAGQVIVLHDITDRKQAEEALKEYSERLEEMVAARTAELQTALQRAQIADKLKTEFVSNVNHELRTPLTNLLLYYQLLNARPEEKTKERLEVIGHELKRLRNLIEDLLNLSHLSLTQEDFYPRPGDLSKLIRTLIDDRYMLAKERKITLQSDLDAVIPQVYMNEVMIGQAVSNLLTNALRYTPAGGCVQIRAEVLNDPSGRPWAVISVQDTGPGISAEDLEHIFERFYRGEAGHESNVPGTGLGLAIVKEVVERHHGRIEAENNATGHGAIFKIWLPVEPEQQAG